MNNDPPSKIEAGTVIAFKGTKGAVKEVSQQIHSPRDYKIVIESGGQEITLILNEDEDTVDLISERAI